MVQSLDSTRPIMEPSLASHRASKRFSTYSGAPSEVTSIGSNTSAYTGDGTSSSSTSTVKHGDPRVREINAFSRGLERLNSPHLQQQRYQPTAEKSESLSKLALGAKVERALGRRLTSQDAVLRAKPVMEMNEKQGDRTTVKKRRTVV